MEKRLINVGEAAGYLGVKVSTLRAWVWKRKIPFVRIGRLVKFEISCLEDFVDRNRVESKN